MYFVNDSDIIALWVSLGLELLLDAALPNMFIIWICSCVYGSFMVVMPKKSTAITRVKGF